jgi:hypothetical protein
MRVESSNKTSTKWRMEQTADDRILRFSLCCCQVTGPPFQRPTRPAGGLASIVEPNPECFGLTSAVWRPIGGSARHPP